MNQCIFKNVYNIVEKFVCLNRVEIFLEEGIAHENEDMPQAKYNYNPVMLGLSFPLKKFWLSAGIALYRFTYTRLFKPNLLGMTNVSLSYQFNKSHWKQFVYNFSFFEPSSFFLEYNSNQTFL